MNTGFLSKLCKVLRLTPIHFAQRTTWRFACHLLIVYHELTVNHHIVYSFWMSAWIVISSGVANFHSIEDHHISGETGPQYPTIHTSKPTRRCRGHFADAFFPRQQA